MSAARAGNPASIQVLLQAGVDPARVDYSAHDGLFYLRNARANLTFDKSLVGSYDPAERRERSSSKIHFRNVSAPLPHFTETMIDDGYFDMSKIMKALVEVKFEGIAIPDHVPALGGNPATRWTGRCRQRGAWRVSAQPRTVVFASMHELDADRSAG